MTIFEEMYPEIDESDKFEDAYFINRIPMTVINSNRFANRN